MPKDKLRFTALDDNSIDINNPNSDLLNHKQYVDILTEMVKTESMDKNIETIGLVGSWGAGKSSIIKAFCSRIKNEQLNGRDVRAKVYNAWKYSKDDFRKAFLLDAEESEKERVLLEKRMYQEVTSSKFVFTHNKYIKWGFAFLIVIALCVAVCCGLNALNEWIKLALDFAGLGIVGATAYCLKIIISQDQTTIIKSFSTHDFSIEFDNIINRSKHFNLFIIDDLDRCKPEQALDILEIIQGYLKNNENTNYMFIIPLDQDRLLSYLEEERNYDDVLASQYFNKIFDIKIEIRNSGRVNIFEMLQTINDKFSYGLSNSALSIIADYLVSTPRDVKKHLNSINLQRMLLQDYQDAKAHISDDQIVKLYILKTVWKDNYYSLVNNYNDYDDINGALIEKSKESKDALFKKFVSNTKSIDITPIQIYEYQKAEIKPDDNLLTAIFENDHSYILELLDNGVSVENICNALDYMYRVYVLGRKLGKEYIWSIVETYLWLLNNCIDSKYEIAKCINFNQLLKAIVDADSDYTEDERDELKNKHAWDGINEMLIEYIGLYSGEEFFNNSIENIIDTLIKTSHITLLCKVLAIDKNATLLPSNTRNKAMLFLVNGDGILNSEFGNAIAPIDKAIISENTVNEIIEKDNRSAIITLSIELPELIAGKFDDVIRNVKFDDYIKQNPSNWNEEYFSEFSQILDYLRSLLNSNCDEACISLDVVLEEQKSLINSFITTCLRSSENTLFENTIAALYEIICIVDSRKKEYSRCIEYIKLIKRYEKYNHIALKLYNSASEDDEKAELIIANLGIFDFNQEACDIFFDEIYNIKSISDYIAWIPEMVKAKSKVSETFEHVGTISFDYSCATSFFIDNCWKLPDEYFIEVINNMPLNDTLQYSGIMEHAQTCGDSIKLILIEKATLFEECVELYKYFPHPHFVKAYHQITRGIIEGASNVTLLKTIHDCEQTDRDELRWIRNKMERDFVSSIDYDVFYKIAWE